MLKPAEFQATSGCLNADVQDGAADFPPLGRDLKVLLIWPRFPASFWSFEGVLKLIRIEANHPPLGLLTVAALCPKNWKLRLLDRCFEELRD